MVIFSFWDVHDKRSAILDISRSFPRSQSFKGFYHNSACDSKAKTFSTGGPLYSITAECQLTLMDQHFELLLMTPSVIQSLYYYGLLQVFVKSFAQYIIGCIMWKGWYMKKKFVGKFKSIRHETWRKHYFYLTHSLLYTPYLFHINLALTKDAYGWIISEVSWWTSRHIFTKHISYNNIVIISENCSFVKHPQSTYIHTVCRRTGAVP